MSADVVVTMDIVLKLEAAPHFAQMGTAGLQATASFPGCRGVQIIQHKEDSTRYLFVERWETEQAYRDYITWRKESGQFQALESICASMSINIWPHIIAAV